MSRSWLRLTYLLPALALVFLLAACASPIPNGPAQPRLSTATSQSNDILNTPKIHRPTANTSIVSDMPNPTHTTTPIPSSPMVFNTATIEISPTPTLLPTGTSLPITRFAVIGDFGLAGQPEADVAALVKNWNPDFIITTGDNNYPDGAPEMIDENIGQYYQEFIYPYKGKYGEGAEVNRFFPTLGNHDWTTDQAQPHFDYFELPGNERYYDFVWGPVHFFAIDSDSREPDGVGRSSIQGQWLMEGLATSTATWKIVYMHQPPYSSSHDGSIDWAQWPYKEWGATAVIAGHSHVYERLVIDAFPYFVNGLGGGPIYTFNQPIPGSELRFREDYGAMLVEATSGQITFQFITRKNQVIDTYSISR